MQLTTLLITYTSSLLPTALHHSWMCSSGSQGYHALKEMLQNGQPGNTLLIESGDLRSLSKNTTFNCDNDDDKRSWCLLVYTSTEGGISPCSPRYQDHIPSTTHHIQLFTNQRTLSRCLLQSCSEVSTVDLTALSSASPSHMTKIRARFLAGCSGLKTIDISPFSNVSDLREYFLSGCTSLTEIDLSPLSKVTRLHKGFLKGCAGLKRVDLSPLVHLTHIPEMFLEDCRGLTTFDLTPLSNLSSSTLPAKFLCGCSGLATIDLSPLSNMRNVVALSSGFLQECSGLTTIDLSPLARLKTPLPLRFMSFCTGLKSIDFAQLVSSHTSSSSAAITALPLGLLYGCTGLKTLDLSPLVHLKELPPDLLIWDDGSVHLILPPHLEKIK